MCLLPYFYKSIFFMTKKVYLIRHAQSYANAANDLDNPKFYYDSPITDVGKQQALKARNRLSGINFDLLVCSPLTRTLETFSTIFENPISNTIILPLVREHLDHSCDVGSNPNILQKKFTQFNFSKINNYWWNNDIFIDEKKINKESLYNLDKRVALFKDWIIKRDEKTIGVVSHGTFISRIIHFFLENCEHEVWSPDND